jgi:molybdopterin molybdotransferase
MSTLTTATTITEASCADDYDPNSMPVAKARAFIHQFLEPVRGTERVPIRSAVGRVLAEDIHSPVDVPSHRNSAMDGWAMRGADLAAGEATLAEIGVSFAGKPFSGKRSWGS